VHRSNSYQTCAALSRSGHHPDSCRKLPIGGLAQGAELVHHSVAFPLIRECPHSSTTSKKAQGNAIER
jgi:hypothetical protein